MILAIDFDGVINDPKNVKPGFKMGEPIDGAIESVNALARHHKVIIHTVRAGTPGGQKAVEDWLKHFGVTHDHVTAIKPQADLYLDDKAIRFTDWDNAMVSIRARGRGRG